MLVRERATVVEFPDKTVLRQHPLVGDGAPWSIFSRPCPVDDRRPRGQRGHEAVLDQWTGVLEIADLDGLAEPFMHLAQGKEPLGSMFRASWIEYPGPGYTHCGPVGTGATMEIWPTHR